MSKVMVYLYFAYGSNLLASRMHVQNPNATRAGIARLENHRLDFNFYSNRWKGYAATIVPDEGKHVWGALWEITDLDSLDQQEGVSDKIYFPLNVKVVKPDNSTVEARTYQLVNLPDFEYRNLPSRVYLETILQGARESGLPEEYIKNLKTLSHNGIEGPITVKNFNITFSETNPFSMTRAAV